MEHLGVTAGETAQSKKEGVMFKLVTSVLVVGASLGAGVLIGETVSGPTSSRPALSQPAAKGWTVDTYICTGIVCTDHQ
jgi:hypothetical protein